MHSTAIFFQKTYLESIGDLHKQYHLAPSFRTIVVAELLGKEGRHEPAEVHMHVAGQGHDQQCRRPHGLATRGELRSQALPATGRSGTSLHIVP